MKYKIKSFVRDSLKSLLGKKHYMFYRFIITHRYFPNFESPKTWNEKIQHRKIYGGDEYLSKFVDKYYVRDYVKEKIGIQYLIPLIRRFQKITPKDFSELPNQFVLKASNGGGGNHVFVVKDKDEVNAEHIIQFLNSTVKEKFGARVDENFYDIKDASIVAEKVLENSDFTTLLDYKFHVFSSNEENTTVLLQINSDYGNKNETKTLYDLKGNMSNIQFSGYSYGNEKIDVPSNIDTMVDLAVKLLGDLKYARIDFYNIDNIIYFGEITVCPASGWDKLNNKKNDLYLGSLWE